MLDAIEEARAGQLDAAVPTLSLFGLAGLDDITDEASTRLLLPRDGWDSALLGSADDRARRNQLTQRSLATEAAKRLDSNVSLRFAPTAIPQAVVVARDGDGTPDLAVHGSFDFTTAGLGIAPSPAFNLIQATTDEAEVPPFAEFFERQWASLQPDEEAESELRSALHSIGTVYSPLDLYAMVLRHLFEKRGEALDEDQVVNSATGIKDTVVWNKLYKFQRDGVVGAIDKLDKYGGCIIADSVGLGKTFEALAVIKYHELRNDRVLVLCPKRLRDNWTLYAANDRRNVLANDRFNYDVLNHTDLSRDGGLSGDIDLANVNWGNYDLVVIDESHNFRNKKTPRAGKETRYDRLMRQIVKEGVKTRVLMLSATPVNNRLADLRNQIAFATEGRDDALEPIGIASIDSTTRRAQQQFNKWLDLNDAERTPGRLVDMLGFDYFTLLDTLTIARSRRHIEKYYGTAETGEFPERRKPINIKQEIDTLGRLPKIGDINDEIRRLNLAAYAPLRYVLSHKQDDYDRKYSTVLGSGKGYFRQADREESLIHLMRVNMLKRLESSIHSFALTIERQLDGVTTMIERIDDHDSELEELDITDVDVDDPTFESLLVGRKVKVLVADVDRIRWRQDLVEDRDRFASLLETARKVTPDRDAKLEALRDMIAEKAGSPINDGNRKVLIFTAFADTAKYLYDNLATWADLDLNISSALVTGSGGNQTTLPDTRRDLASILSAFAPKAKERPADLADTGEIDLLIATDCISEGQNLQDCDWLVNYDIHWNPVRIIQRFGRIDRIGSHNESIQLVNFWPNMELEEYINLEQRVSGRMVLLDVSATGEENLIEQQSGDPMNDLEYRRRQLLKLQDAVIDLEDISTNVSITDLTLTDFRIDLADYMKEHGDPLKSIPEGATAITPLSDTGLPPGITFCLKADDATATRIAGDGYPLAPYFVVHVSDDETVHLPFTQAKAVLDELRRSAATGSDVDPEALALLNAATKEGADMAHPRALLAAAVTSLLGRGEERAVESLFKRGGTHAFEGEFAGVDEFEVIALGVVVGEDDA